MRLAKDLIEALRVRGRQLGPTDGLLMALAAAILEYTIEELEALETLVEEKVDDPSIRERLEASKAFREQMFTRNEEI